MRVPNDERKNNILKYVLSKEKATISELATFFNVTMETIRRDVAELETKDLLVKKHGSVTLPPLIAERSMKEKDEEHRIEKKHIAEFAAKLIPKNSTLFLDSGTTTAYLAKQLLTREDLVIFTNSLPIGEILSSSKNKFYILGGQFREKSQSLVGGWTEKQISQINADISFLSCFALSEKGPSVHSYREMSVKSLMVNQSKKSILLLDTSKFNHFSTYTFTEFYKLDSIITERSLSSKERKQIPAEVEIKYNTNL